MKDLERLKADVNNDWLKAFYKHGFSNHDKTVNIMHEVLLWRKDFDANSKKTLKKKTYNPIDNYSNVNLCHSDLLTPGNLPFPLDYLHKGSIFFRNEDINLSLIHI